MSIERHTVGADMFKAMAVYAPAMGMIGTLIGLVQMLANMSDPAAIGPRDGGGIADYALRRNNRQCLCFTSGREN